MNAKENHKTEPKSTLTWNWRQLYLQNAFMILCLVLPFPTVTFCCVNKCGYRLKITMETFSFTAHQEKEVSNHTSLNIDVRGIFRAYM